MLMQSPEITIFAENSNPKNYHRIKLEELNDDGVINLISRVVSDSVDDYKTAIKHNSKDWMDSMERFFMSKYFSNLTGLNGSDVISTAKRMAEEEMEELKENPDKKVIKKRRMYVKPKKKGEI